VASPAISVMTGAVLFVALALSDGSTNVNRDGVYRFNYENLLGTSLEMKFAAGSEAQARRAEAAALNEIEREATILSRNNGSVARRTSSLVRQHLLWLPGTAD
jgi:thiamine biosynthesis lipoprotein